MTREEALQAIKEKMDYYESDKRLRGAIETLIPELAESEDEKFRKYILQCCKECIEANDKGLELSMSTTKKLLAYLEKQKEQKSVSAEELLVKAGLKHYKDGNMWCILVGDNIQEGICGFGNTIDEALYQFLMEVLEKQKDLTTENIYKHSRERMSFWNGQQKEQNPISFNVPFNPDDYEVVMEGNATGLKLKENPKSADSIPSDCTSDAKCEDRWHKVADSMPDNPREVLCEDEAGNYFIGRYYTGEGWEISNYDDEDKPHHLNPPVSKWIDFPSEKQNEQKPMYNLEIPAGDVAPAEEDGPFDEDEFLENELSAFLQNYDKEYDDDAAVSDVARHFYEIGKKQNEQKVEIGSKIVAPVGQAICIDPELINPEPKPIQKEQKPVDLSEMMVHKEPYLAPVPTPMVADEQKQEWSEEDKKLLNKVEVLLDDYCDFLEDENSRFIPEVRETISRLKSLRPQPKAELTLLDKNIINAAVAFVEQNNHFNCWGGIDKHTVIKALRSLKPSWKPSEEQMAALEAATVRYQSTGLESLFEDLKKL